MPDLTAVVPLIAWNCVSRSVSAWDKQRYKIKWKKKEQQPYTYPDGEVIDHDEGSGAGANRVQASGDHGPLADNASRNGAVFLVKHLGGHERDEQHTEDDEQRDDSGVRPRVLHATPLQGQQEGDGGAYEEDSSNRVEFLDDGKEGFAALAAVAAAVFQSKQKHDTDGRDGAHGQVDIEAPAPGDLVCERASQLRRNERTHSQQSENFPSKRRTTNNVH